MDLEHPLVVHPNTTHEEDVHTNSGTSFKPINQEDVHTISGTYLRTQEDVHIHNVEPTSKLTKRTYTPTVEPT